jgi:hypothetical protein
MVTVASRHLACVPQNFFAATIQGAQSKARLPTGKKKACLLVAPLQIGQEKKKLSK